MPESTKKNQFAEHVAHFDSWLSSPVGQEVLLRQQKIIDEYLETLFGYHLLQLSASKSVFLSHSSQIKHQCILHPLAADDVAVYFDDDQLPVATESVDVVILHHLLGLCENPHHLLKEISRILIPSGHVIISGFNPYSFLGLTQLCKRLLRKKSLEHVFSINRLLDWMKLVDFSLQKVKYDFYLPPTRLCLNSKVCSKVEKKLQQSTWPLGAFYVLQAQKIVMPYTPIKPRHRLFSGEIIKPVMKPSIPASKSTQKDNK